MDEPEEQASQESATHLRRLGPGVGSKVEQIKIQSNYLRGQIAEELAQPTTHFSDSQIHLLKFHGIYQQEDRDARQARKAAGVEKPYQLHGSLAHPRRRRDRRAISGRRTTWPVATANDTLRITTRQGFQLHGVLKGDLHAAIHGINESLLSTLAACGDVNRNVMACPAPDGQPRPGTGAGDRPPHRHASGPAQHAPITRSGWMASR